MDIRRIALASLTAATALALAACGSDDAGSAGSASDTSTTATSQTSGSSEESPDDTTSEDSGTDEEQTSSDDSASSGDVDTKDLEKVVATAEDEAGGTAYEIDDQDEDGTWEVDVAKDGKTSVEVDVSADGSKVVSTDDDDDLDSEDRRALDAAKITVTEAVEAAMEEADGTFDDVELETEDGKHFWEVSLDGPSGDDTEVRVDVQTGKAAVHQDNDNDDN